MVRDDADSTSANGHGVQQSTVPQAACPNIIARIQEQFPPSWLHVYEVIGGTQNDKNHTACDESTCLANDIQLPSDFQPKHTTSQCCCAMLGPEADELQTIYMQGKIPLIRICNDVGSVDIRLEAWVEGTSFVAVSHALADGLCNLTENKLPRCQLERLREQAAALLSSLDDRFDGAVSIWIDVLCMPVHNLTSDGESPESFHAMQQAMQHSSAMLVVDSDIRELRRESSYPEKFLRIAYSSWGSRLWTLYETMLAPWLFFEAEDGPLGLAEVDGRRDMRLRTLSPSWQPLLPYKWLRERWSPEKTKLMLTDPEDFKKLDRIVEGRRTSSDKDLVLLMGQFGARFSA